MAERALLLAAFDRFVPLDAEEAVRSAMLRITTFRTDESASPAETAPIAASLSTSRDPTVLSVAAHALLIADYDVERRDAVDALVLSDPRSPRYGGFLVLEALLRYPEEAVRAAVSELAIAGLPDDRWNDDLALARATVHPTARLPDELRADLERSLLSDRRRNTTEHLTRRLARDDEARGRAGDALARYDRFADRYGPEAADFGPARALLLEARGRADLALDALVESLRRHGGDPRRYEQAGRLAHRLGADREAATFYKFFLARIDARARGEWPFGPELDLQQRLSAHATVWSAFAAMRPSFFARSALRHVLELLGDPAAALLALARVGRARRYLLPSLLAAEIAFFGGLLAIRSIGPATLLSTAWLFASTAQTFVLVAAGLYLSGAAGFPRRRPRPARLAALSVAVAAVVGAYLGTDAGPVFLPDGLPFYVRTAELGIGPRSWIEAPGVLAAVLRDEACARLVWPALVAMALAPVQAGTRSTTRTAAVIAVASLLSSVGGLVSFPLAFAGSVGLHLLRFRAGVAASFAAHAAFSIGTVAGSLGVSP